MKAIPPVELSTNPRIRMMGLKQIKKQTEQNNTNKKIILSTRIRELNLTKRNLKEEVKTRV
jgi:hypothetical protein